MVTLAPGQLVAQNEHNGRIWRLVERTRRDQFSPWRWTISLVDPMGTDRHVGETVAVSEEWLQVHCADHSMFVDPPLGDGVQTCAISDALRVCTTAAQAIEWFAENLQPDQVGLWFGWGTDSVANESPDLTCRLEEGALVWSE